MSNTDEALELLKHLADFAYEQGFHECGYDPVELLRSEIALLKDTREEQSRRIHHLESRTDEVVTGLYKEIAQLSNDVALRDHAIEWMVTAFSVQQSEIPAEFAEIIRGAK